MHVGADFCGASHLCDSTQARYAATVTSVRSIQKLATWASCAGFSFGAAFTSFVPIVNFPPATWTIPSF